MAGKHPGGDADGPLAGIEDACAGWLDPLTVAIDGSGAFGSANDPAAVALRSVALIGELRDVDRFSQRPLVRDAEAIGRNGLNKAVPRFDHQLAVTIDQAGLAVDIDLREAEPVVADDAIARRHDLAPGLIDEAIKAAAAHGDAPT